jgi:uncharacterized protein YpuA (DUF1002 family)
MASIDPAQDRLSTNYNADVPETQIDQINQFTINSNANIPQQ